ncbi:proteasome assembly chaperone 4 [Gadus morhua]|uniref:Proteasome assembly chaperone 4 n=1 Tax=Gadus morhua TaxID=8049 RepID=A0A8C4ZMU1_GADMO|nr:proteasome assembly chaperone 4 [Gadus morhua]XP_056459881.1 proteasome assembly chaperone 4 [Gadus chalcogrammus]XP_059923565.1 proteasome assembly chaperone 4 [Gadus macrocephalus]
MSGAEQGDAFDAITVYNFCEKISEQTIHFHVMKMNGGFFLWVGASPTLSNLAVSMISKFDSVPLSMLLMGDKSETAPNALAQRLAKKTNKQVFVSYNLPMVNTNLALQVEDRIKKEMGNHPEHF